MCRVWVANEPHDRDRVRPRGPTPPLPPCVRVRTRQFGLVDRLSTNRWKPERADVAIGQGDVQRRAPTQPPDTVWGTHRLGRQIAANPARRLFLEPGPAGFPLLPEEAAKATPDPFIQILEHTGRFTEAEVATPTRQVSLQRGDHLVDADLARALSQLPDSRLEAGQRLGRDAPFDRHPQARTFAVYIDVAIVTKKATIRFRPPHAFTESPGPRFGIAMVAGDRYLHTPHQGLKV